MSWKCKCGLILVNLVKQCYCKEKRPDEFEPFDSVDEAISIMRRRKLDRILGEVEKMTPQEELFSKLFNHEKILVKDMDLLTLRAHREELAQIAFEARARLAATDDEENGRKKKARDSSKPTGFERSVASDDKTSDAINTIRKRETRLNKMDRVKQNMLNIPGMDPKFVESVMSARNIRDQISKINLGAAEHTAINPVNDSTIAEPKKVSNPFAKKE